jgi:hypothetical protein
MSTKTLRKRIALVAVATLGAGVLSAAPANAGTGVFVYTATSGIGVIVAPAGTGTGQTMTISETGRVYVTTVAGTGASTSGGRLTVSGGTIISAVDGETGLPIAGYGTPSSTTFIYGETVGVFGFAPNAGATSMTITAYQTSTTAAAGTKAAEMIVLVKAAASVGVVSESNSFAKVVAAATTTAAADDVDVAGTTAVAAPTSGRINYRLYDGNNVLMPTTTVVTATATGGCTVGLSNSATAFLGATATETSYTQAGDEFFVARSVTNAPFKCTVTLTANGVPFATKSITLQGKVVKVEVDGGQAGISNGWASATYGTNAAAFYYSAYDSAGNAVNGVTVENEVTSTSAFSSVTTSATTDVVDGATGSIVCTGDAKGSGTFLLKVTNNAADVVKSVTYTANCFGSPYTYAASLDKASYVPGDIATLTITAKDSAGNVANDYTYLGGTSAAGFGTTNPVSIAGSNMTAITAPSSTDMFVGGKKTYKFIVGSTEGSYQLSVDLPKFNNTLAPQTAATVAYKIAGSGGVSNADVLKAIVSLIASINKQIAALQKALLKK